MNKSQKNNNQDSLEVERQKREEERSKAHIQAFKNSARYPQVRPEKSPENSIKSLPMISAERWLEAARNSRQSPQVRPYVLLSSLNFSYPNKSEEQKKKILKTAENNSEFLFNLLRKEYKSRYMNNKYRYSDKEVFQEAIGALDVMKEKYITLKAKKYTLNELLEITQMWFLYLHTIEVMIANITSDADLLRSAEDLDPAQAKILSKEIWSDFDVKLSVAKQLGL